MKIFQRIQNDFETIGIGLHQRSFNLRILLVLFVMCNGITSNCGYFSGIAKTFPEYAKSIFVATNLISASIIFAYIAWKMRQFFDMLNEAEKIIDGSRLKF